MPELPEVEVIRRGLLPAVRGRIFLRPRLLFPGSIRYPEPEKFCLELAGRAILDLGRRGKYLVFSLDQGELVVHLRMTGRLVFNGSGADPDRHLRVVLPFTDGTALYFSDMRKFGGLWLYGQEEAVPPTGYHRQGPDIHGETDLKLFRERLRLRPRARLKSLLLNQGFVSGLGNIYVDECLFRCCLHPCRTAGSLSGEETGSLYAAIREVLAEGILHGGTSTRDYRDARGERGRFQSHLKVYGRKGEPCSRCGETIARTVTAGRGTYYCPGCQPEERSAERPAES